MFIYNVTALPNDWLKDEFELPKTAPCIISTLAEIKCALSVEAATMKEYNWKPVIKTFFKKGVSISKLLLVA